MDPRLEFKKTHFFYIKKNQILKDKVVKWKKSNLISNIHRTRPTLWTYLYQSSYGEIPRWYGHHHCWWNFSKWKTNIGVKIWWFPISSMESNGSRIRLWKIWSCSFTYPQKYHQLQLIFSYFSYSITFFHDCTSIYLIYLVIEYT